MRANDTQVGGSHYKRPGVIEHWDMVEMYGLGYLEGCATKYLARYSQKGGVQDLEKAGHYTLKLIEMVREQGRGPRGSVPDYIIEQFCVGMDEMQRDAIRLLCQWRTTAQLELVLNNLDSLIWSCRVDQETSWGRESYRPGTPEDGGHHGLQPSE